MEPLPQSTIDQLANPDQLSFEAALVEVDAAVSRGELRGAALLIAICQRLSSADALGPVERRRRAGLILTRAQLSDSICRDLARASQTFKPEIRNEVATALPAKFKCIAYGQPAPKDGTLVLDMAQEKDSPTPTPRSEAPSESGVVLLLGNSHEHERNRKLLKANGLYYVRVTTPDEFRNLLGDDVCGVVVAKSWWTVVSSESYSSFLDELLLFSSLACLKINTDGTTEPDIRRKSTEIRFREAKSRELLLGESNDISTTDLRAFREAAAAAQHTTQVRLHPGEITTGDAKLIVAVAQSHARGRLGTSKDCPSEVSVRILSGGRSDAMLVHVSLGRRLLPFVVKIGNIDQLRDEMDRFTKFIACLDHKLIPELHFHKGRGAIVFGLVDDPDDPWRAAPTLYDTIHDCLLAETGGVKKCPSESDLSTIINRVIAKLQRFNLTSCKPYEVESLAWTGVDGIDKMDNCNISWKLPSLPDGRSPLELRHDAAEHLQKLGNPCIIHGDVHLRNILVRDQKEPYLIDYAYAGPGPPCYDLVRFECALLFQMFRMTDKEEVIRELLLKVGRGGADMTQLESEFPSLCAGVGNRTAILASIGVREACMELLVQYDADESDYHAMKMVVSCQALADPDRQAGIVRATISTAAQLFADTVKVQSSPLAATR